MQNYLVCFTITDNCEKAVISLERCYGYLESLLDENILADLKRTKSILMKRELSNILEKEIPCKNQIYDIISNLPEDYHRLRWIHLLFAKIKDQKALEVHLLKYEKRDGLIKLNHISENEKVYYSICS